MNTIKIALAAALLVSASAASFANGLTDHDPQFVLRDSMANTYVPTGTHTNCSAGTTASQCK